MPSRIRPHWQGYGRPAFHASWSGGSETITLYDGLYSGVTVKNSINAMRTGPYSFAVDMTAHTSTITTSESVIFSFLDADLAAFLGFSATPFAVLSSLGNTSSVEHSAFFASDAGDLRYQRRFVGNASQAASGALGRPGWAYRDTIQFALWAHSDEVAVGIGALRRLTRCGGYFLFDGLTTGAWHLEHLNGMARIMFREPMLALADLVVPEADIIRQLNFDLLVEGISP